MVKYFFIALILTAIFGNFTFAQVPVSTAPFLMEGEMITAAINSTYMNEEILREIYNKYKKTDKNEFYRQPLRYRASVRALEDSINDIKTKRDVLLRFQEKIKADAISPEEMALAAKAIEDVNGGIKYNIRYIESTRQFQDEDIKMLQAMRENLSGTLNKLNAPVEPLFVPPQEDRTFQVPVYEIPSSFIMGDSEREKSERALLETARKKLATQNRTTNNNWFGIPYLNDYNLRELKNWFFGPSPERRRRVFPRIPGA